VNHTRIIVNRNSCYLFHDTRFFPLLGNIEHRRVTKSTSNRSFYGPLWLDIHVGAAKFAPRGNRKNHPEFSPLCSPVRRPFSKTTMLDRPRVSTRQATPRQEARPAEFVLRNGSQRSRVDGRDKPGHDGWLNFADILFLKNGIHVILFFAPS
jgi:hypothetical protein